MDINDIEFKALFSYFLTSGKKVWLVSTVNHKIDTNNLVRKTDWLQYVGKKDIHNEKIYEGDVFRFKYLEELHKPIELVGSFTFGTDLSFEIDIYNNETYTVLHYIDNGQFYDFELLGGNIKETPDFAEELIEIEEEQNDSIKIKE